MGDWVRIVGWSVASALKSQRDLTLENVALRHGFVAWLGEKDRPPSPGPWLPTVRTQTPLATYPDVSSSSDRRAIVPKGQGDGGWTPHQHNQEGMMSPRMMSPRKTLCILALPLILSAHGFQTASAQSVSVGRSDSKLVSPLPGSISADGDSQRTKNPYLAGGLSALLPGMGQFYNGQKSKGALHLVLWLGSAFAAAGWPEIIPEEVGQVGRWGSWIWSVVDAPLSAKAINEDRVGVSVGLSTRPMVGLEKAGPVTRPVIDVAFSVRVPRF